MKGTISERLREGIIADAHESGQITSGSLAERLIRERSEAADTIDVLVAALDLVKSMRAVDALSPAEHEFERAKRREAWNKIAAEIDAALAKARKGG